MRTEIERGTASPSAPPSEARPGRRIRTAIAALAGGLLLATLAVMPAAAARPRDVVDALPGPQVSGSCTGWTDQYTPPSTIRVLRTYSGSPALGTVQQVDFRTYVETVLASEWPGFYPIETLKAGAVAVKQYAWYHAMKWRGGKAADGSCYDVKDNTADQVYRPESARLAQSHLRAVDATWRISVRKMSASTGTSRFFLTGYRSGEFVPCGTDADGTRIYQHSAFYCGKTPTGANGKGMGLAREGIQRAYYYPGLEIVEPGRHDIVGGRHGDAAALVALASVGRLAPRVFSSDGDAFAADDSSSPSFDATELVAHASGDVNGDRKEDLLLAYRSESELRIDVAFAESTGYDAAATWWSSSEAALLAAPIDMVVGDFDADGRADAGILAAVPGASPPQSTLKVLLSTGGGFAASADWWTGRGTPARLNAYAADPTGDGRADLILEADRGTLGLRYAVAPSRNHGGGLNPRVNWLDLGDLRVATVRTAIGDYDRDGYDDLFVVAPAPTGSRLLGLRSNGLALEARELWRSDAAEAEEMAFDRLKLGAGDFDYDGRSDAVLFVDHGDGGTGLMALISTGSELRQERWLESAGLEWEMVLPF